MHDRRFDALTRRLTFADSRRALLRRLGGGLLGAAGLTGFAATASAKGDDAQSRGQRCRRSRDCPGATRCRDGRCACRRERERCLDACCRPGELCCNPLLGVCIKPGEPCPR